MNKVKQAIMAGCTYSIIIISLFLLFAAIGGATEIAMSPLKFFLLTLFGILISFVNLLISMLRKNALISELIRYILILALFLITCSITKTIEARASAVISVGAIFTVVYILLVLGCYAVNHLLKRKTCRRQIKDKSKNDKDRGGAKYQPLYSTDRKND